MIDSATTTDDTTIATTGRVTLVRNVAGLGTKEPSDGVDEEGVGTGELRLGATEIKIKGTLVRSATCVLAKWSICTRFWSLPKSLAIQHGLSFF